MAKMVNPNTVSNMDLINAKSQAKMQQIVQKVGKGKRKVNVTFSKMSRSYLTRMIEEMRKMMKQFGGIMNDKSKRKGLGRMFGGKLPF